MAYVPGYAGDVFISYAHRDNEFGWVTELKSKLSSRLNFDLGGSVEVWFDSDRLQTGDVFKQEIRDQLNSTMIFVAVVSRAYLQSGYCMAEEFDYFLNVFGRDVIQLQIQALADDDTPPLSDPIYEHLYDPSSNLPVRDVDLDNKLHKPIASIRSKLESARAACPKIYLAQPAADALKVSTQQLARALHRARLAVLPAQVVTTRTLPSRIRKWIEDSRLSIHISSPDPLSTSQLEIAQDTGLPTLILPRPPRESELPAIVEQTNTLLDQTAPRHEIYFVYDYYSDHQHAAPITNQLAALQSGRQVVFPQPGETYHQKKILESDGIVLFRREAPLAWFESHREKLKQMTALRRNSIAKEAYYVVGPGNTNHLTCLGGPDRFEITRTGVPDAADLLPFLNALGPVSVSASSSTTTAGGPR